ncbi:MAG TPA: hypothetical protein VIY86_10210, partial [Pirellulaceae bacterium]
MKNPFGTPLSGNLDHVFTVPLAEGNTGDVILGDLKQAFGGTSFTNLIFPGYTLVTDALSDIHLQKFAAEDAKVVLSTRAENQPFVSTGRFYLIPEAEGPVIDTDLVSPGFQGTIAGQITVNGVVRNFQIVVRKGFSSEGPHVVVGGTNVVARLRGQQRLKHFGFPGADGQKLVVDGNFGQRSQEATRLFNAALHHQPKDPTDATELLLANEYGPGTLNSTAAPRWRRFEADPGITFVPPDSETCIALGLLPNCTNPELWGTSWARNILRSAGSARLLAVQSPLKLLYISPAVGGETAIDESTDARKTLRAARLGSEFDGGRELAFDVPTDENLNQVFYKTRIVPGYPNRVA